ncbi:HAD-IIIC family phosphatase [Actinokineospora sp. NBRC 105648]|uniref:HAD-IIIC family phosphatase n=1 Tax=Actinokineospora sp. NBRC 105648 TaxID=3032206 RepID=UPI0024A4C3E6|nr:HAD-IIIC family phosphatase [Actinokineospora sp. NBRC 105648]GLZ40816.1 HAD-superfamily phosphatase, subfamily IIIC:FkbH [Actinokineospora sp. NBRC 105648]
MTQTPLDEVRALHRAGALAEHHDRLPALLAGLSEQDTAVAARLLAGVDPEAVRERHPRLPRIDVTITGHGLVNTLGAALTAELTRHGYAPRVRVADFGAYAQDLDDPGSGLYADRADLTVAVLDHRAVFDEVGTSFTVADVERVLAEKLALWRRLADRFRAHGTGTLVFNTIPLPREWSARLLDHPARARLGIAWRAANAELLALGAEPGPVAVLDLDPLLAEARPLSDPRFATYVHAHLSDALQSAYARDLAHLARARTGRAKKVLALDLDNTLWGGVLGDDGVTGIEVAHTPRGEAFQAVQRLAVQLKAQRILLAVVSKNDADTVLAAFKEHPDLLVRAEDLVRVSANWGPKAQSLRELATGLNLGLDSVVFADDSAHECAAVRAELPEVTVIHLAGDPAEHVGRLLADDWFASTEVTAEDRVRTTRYHEESARAEFLSAADGVGDFLAGLGITVRLAPATDAELARVAQLTLRTNQFNLTTRRLQPNEIAAYAEDPAKRVLTITSADRFGANGIVGALLLSTDDEDLRVDNFLLSCRVFARGIEQAALSAVLTAARLAGFRSVLGEFRPTAKNAKVADLYPHYGFAATTPTDGGQDHRHELETVIEIPSHLRLDAADGLVPAVLRQSVDNRR